VEVWQVARFGRLKKGVTGWEEKWRGRGRGRSNPTARVVSRKYTAAKLPMLVVGLVRKWRGDRDVVTHLLMCGR
jgi:hypothetical protein